MNKVFILYLGYAYEPADKILAFESSAKAKDWCRDNLELSKSKWTKCENYYLYEGEYSQRADTPRYSNVKIYWSDVL